MDLLSNTTLSDFEIVTPTHTYKVHKLILYRCEYFVALIQSGIKESSDNSVSLPYDGEIFDLFLHILYTNRIDKYTLESSEIAQLFDICVYLQYKNAIDTIVNEMNDIHSTCLEHLFPLLLTAHSEFIVKINNKVFSNKCNEYASVILDNFQQINNEIFAVKVLHELKCVSCKDILMAIDKWIDTHSINLWPKIINLNFTYDKYDHEFLIANPGYMSYDIVSKRVNNFHSLIFHPPLRLLEEMDISPYGQIRLVPANKQQAHLGYELKNECTEFQSKDGNVSYLVRINKYKHVSVDACVSNETKFLIIVKLSNALIDCIVTKPCREVSIPIGYMNKYNPLDIDMDYKVLIYTL